MEGESASSTRAEAGPSRGRLYGLLAAMLVFWAGNFIVGKFALRELPGPLAGVLRIATAGVLVLPAFFYRAFRSARVRPPFKEIPRLLTVGICGIALNQILFIIGLRGRFWRFLKRKI